uniref:Uncharacterized protein n=1 Tax=Anguilla anguilla TaxID=7936 RepID=A0A0E9T1J0_ANGAN
MLPFCLFVLREANFCFVYFLNLFIFKFNTFLPELFTRVTYN